MNINYIFQNVSRAFEIAVLGQHRMQLVFEKDYLRAKSDKLEIERFYNFHLKRFTFQTFDNIFSENYSAIIIEVCRPDFESLNNTRGESIDSVIQRVENARNNERPSVFSSESCNALLKSAYDRLDLGITDINIIYRVASTIAQLDGSNLICPEHIAEAILYRTPINRINEYQKL